MPAIISVVGAGNAGKTRLIERVLPQLRARGLRVGTLKHASHGFELDRHGSDSARHVGAGSARVVLVGPDQRAIFEPDTPDAGQGGPELAALAHRFFRDCDVVIAEGFTWEPGPKVLVHRHDIAPKAPPSPADVVLVVTDESLGYDCEVHPDDIETIADRLAAIIRDLGIEYPDFGVTLLVGGHPVALTGFVSSFLSGAVKGMVAELKGIADDAGEIELYITRV